MATIQVRRLVNGDPQRGGGLSNFIVDREAVGQIIGTTIKLLQGEWFENLNLGTPMFQQLLDHPITLQAVALIMRTRIMSVPYVTGISSMEITYGARGRTLQFIAAVTTQFGAITVSNVPPVA